MPASKTATRKKSASPKSASPKVSPSSSPRAGKATLKRFEQNTRVLARVKKGLDATQRDVAAIHGSIRTGRRDLGKDVAKMLRDTRRDVEKMNTAVRRDLEKLQKDLARAAKAKPRTAARGTKSKPRTAVRGKRKKTTR